ncbi:FAD-binding oxidoreductase [Herbiconiux sp. L3-i23]|uniref:NAD(P)/FAD-dependent oxidoreductase n=1 Tax=Herbiconiux sp. L3-i23 TaxID=2905871 RepID=UPI00206B7CAC|nr:FAD-dependent oxidoreductase [Herbiconiux sp. L3-i23]BDI22020.1 FAD-dependent oxidoreductase [Herbiconiux sp. L3-i23]
MDEALTATGAQAPRRPYRDVSLWLDQVAEQGDDLAPRPPLAGDLVVDVCIVGGGLTGLWTAHYLLEAHPDIRIAILEKEIAGFGASGRNGGWCSALFPASAAALERRHGVDAAVAMRRAMIDTVDEVGRAAEQLGIDCDFVKGGTVAFARSAAQERLARAELDEAQRFGTDPLVTIDPARFGADGARSAVFDPSCARLQPAKLVRGLARSVEARGATIYEGTAAIDFAANRVTTAHGTVHADAVVLALEAYSATLPKTHRRLLPLYSLMIATEPLPAAVWDEIGIEHGQTFGDYRHLLIYGQRTADDRIAFGGRGARYHYASAVRDDYDRVPRVFEHLRQALRELLPATRDARVTHTWGGPIGVPRDWHATVSFNRSTGVGFAGGYVGDGLSTTNLAGRTMADLVTGRRSELTRLPWVGHDSGRWEPEPLRFLGANLGVSAMALADAEERVTGRPSLAAAAVRPLTGH